MKTCATGSSCCHGLCRCRKPSSLLVNKRLQAGHRIGFGLVEVRLKMKFVIMSFLSLVKKDGHTSSADYPSFEPELLLQPAPKPLNRTCVGRPARSPLCSRALRPGDVGHSMSRAGESASLPGPRKNGSTPLAADLTCVWEVLALGKPIGHGSSTRADYP